MKRIAKHLLRSLIQSRESSADQPDRIFSLLPNGLTLLDIGAAGGIQPRWKTVRKSIDYIGVEPDRRSREELEKETRSRSTHILDSFAWDKEEEIGFNLCRKPTASSAYKPNRKLLDLYPDAQRFDIVQKELIAAEPLYQKLSSRKIDFIKLDIQGGELNALRGLGDKIDGCLGVEVEVEFSAMYNSQPLFDDVNRFLLGKGFYFSDFTHLWRWERDANEGFGRCIFGDGLWMRDLESISSRDDGEYMKYAAICSLYYKLDEAMASLSLVNDKNIIWKEFEGILRKQIKLQAQERTRFKDLQRTWGLYSPFSRIHLIE